ncbi:MAG: MFS transporter [Proteobacteria bacterium]|nr:MFS transporter [Pseudomonadota bacterium]
MQSNIDSGAGRVFYGWKVLAALFTAGFLVYGGGLYCFVLFVTPLTQEFHWSRAATGGIVSAFWLSAPLLIAGGLAMRRFGVTRMLAVGIVVEALCVLLLTRVTSLPEMILLRATMGFGKIMFAVTIPVTIAVWFRRRFGFALGIAWAGWHVGGMVLAPVTQAIIERYGWRGACTALGISLLVFALGPILWVQRIRSPAALGLEPDGDPPPAAASTPDAPAASIAAPVPSGTLEDLLKAPLFWLIAAATLCFYMTYGGVLAHQGAIVEAAGYSSGLASIVLGSTAGFAAVGGLATGWMVDHWRLARVGLAMHVMLIAGALSMLSVLYLPSLAGLCAYAACFGIMIGGSDIFFVKLMRERFPHVNIDHAYSVWYCTELGTLWLSGIVAGWIYDTTGNYARTLVVLSASAGVATVLTMAALRHRSR